MSQSQADAAYQRGDYATAIQLLEPLAEGGNASAQYTLGLMYAKGEGVPRDPVQAHFWLDLAAAKGDAEAAKSRDLLAAMMTPSQIAEAQQLARAWMPKTKEQVEPAREAIMKAVFKPARIKGQAVRQLVQQAISFNIGQ